MNTLHRLAIILTAAATVAILGACGSTHAGNAVQSSGTPVNPFTDPGAANVPSAPLTGAQPQSR